MSDNTTAVLKSESRRARGRPKADDLAELEARLVRVARECFVTNGYGATSMNEVARKARVSKGTLYSRFPTKADLFRAIVTDQVLGAGTIVPAREHGKTLEAELRIYAEHGLQDSLRDDILRLNRLIYGEAERFPELGDAAWTRSRIGVKQVSDLIQEYAIKDGIPCRDPETAAELFIALLRGWYYVQMLSGRTVTVPEIKAWTDKTLALFLLSRHNW